MIDKLQQLAANKPLEGQDMFYKRIRRQGIIWNHKRVTRVYRLMGLNKKKRTRKRIPARVKHPLVVPSAPDQTWSMDFMSDRLMNGRRFRVLNIIDDYNREILKIEPYFSITSARVISIIERLIAEKSEYIRVFFLVCIGQDGTVTNLKNLKAERFFVEGKEEDFDFSSVDSGRSIHSFKRYLQKSSFHPAGDWEGNYKVPSEMIVVFESKQKGKGSKYSNKWLRKFEIVNAPN